MDKLVILPFFVSCALLYKKGFTWTFIYWWIPLMLFMPTYLEMDGPGFPPLSFYITGIAPFLFCRQLYQAATKDYHWLDWFVYAFLLLVVLSEYVTTGFQAGRQILFLEGFSLLVPYLAMKHVILYEKKENQVAMMFVYTLAFISFINLYEFRFGVNQFLKLRDYWPSYYDPPNIIVIPRWGFFRAAGPFVHPIVAGMVFGFALPMNFWLTRYGIIKPWWKGILIIGCCLMGVIMTFSRGPILGAILATTLYLIGQSRYRAMLFSTIGLLIFLLSPPTTVALIDYFSGDRATAQSSDQETALYRKELIINYMDIISEKPLLGHGFLNIPYVPGQVSIDNAYILLALNWGVLAPLLVFGLGMCCCLRLFQLGLNRGIDMKSRGIVWAILGGMAGCLFSIATVYMARPVSTIFYMWAGWTVAMSLRDSRGLFLAEAKSTNEEDQATPRASASKWGGMKLL